MKKVFKSKIFISGKFEGEFGFPNGTTVTMAVDLAISTYAHNNRIVIKLYDKFGKILSEKIRRPTKLFGL